MISVRYQVPAELHGQTVGRFLYDRLKLSHALVRRAKAAAGILVDGAAVRTSHVLVGGETVELRVPSEGRVAPEAMPLAVVYEDEQLLVVEKPAGMVVHPVKDYTGGTLANAVAYHLEQRGEEAVVRPVMRIDRNTSGLVLFAKDPAVAQHLSKELGRQKLQRRYLAVAHGAMAAERGTVAVPIRRVWGHPVAREAAVGPRTPEQEALLAEAAAAGRVLRQDWTAAGQRAVTHWEALRRLRGGTLLALALETGRTHQIRVHMAHIGHPLMGDELYGTAGPPGRQALHAAGLVFTHPVTGQLLRFESPLPADIAALVEAMARE